MFADLGIEASIETTEILGSPHVHIACQVDDISWTFDLGQEQTFYGVGFLAAEKALSPDASLADYLNSWNREHAWSVAYVHEDPETESPYRNEDGSWSIDLRYGVSFIGTVSKEHFHFLVELWFSDLVDFFASDEDEPFRLEQLPDLERQDSILDQVHDLLILNGAMTSKHLARALFIPKHEVNHLIYMHLDEFEKHPGQPPLWTSRR